MGTRIRIKIARNPGGEIRHRMRTGLERDPGIRGDTRSTFKRGQRRRV
jgi:hypothetical protein